MTVLSTTSKADLTASGKYVVFSKEIPDIAEAQFLKYPHKWFLTTHEGTCSCGFRHVERWNIDLLGFCEPEEWSPEDEDDILATHDFVDVITSLLKDGDSVDTVTAWLQDEEMSHDLVGDMEVKLSEVGMERFRFYDGYRFEYK
ncbi:hypothetical protein [Geomonas sp. Red276]